MNHFKLFVLDLFTALFPNQMSIKNLDSEWAWVVSYALCHPSRENRCSFVGDRGFHNLGQPCDEQGDH